MRWPRSGGASSPELFASRSGECRNGGGSEEPRPILVNTGFVEVDMAFGVTPRWVAVRGGQRFGSPERAPRHSSIRKIVREVELAVACCVQADTDAFHFRIEHVFVVPASGPFVHHQFHHQLDLLLAVF